MWPWTPLRLVSPLPVVSVRRLEADRVEEATCRWWSQASGPPMVGDPGWHGALDGQRHAVEPRVLDVGVQSIRES
jgi:hypothetical protein